MKLYSAPTNPEDILRKMDISSGGGGGGILSSEPIQLAISGNGIPIKSPGNGVLFIQAKTNSTVNSITIRIVLNDSDVNNYNNYTLSSMNYNGSLIGTSIPIAEDWYYVLEHYQTINQTLWFIPYK